MYKRQLLRRLLAHPDVLANRIDTRFLDRHLAALVAPAADGRAVAPLTGAWSAPVEGAIAVRAPMPGTVVSVECVVGDTLAAGAPLLVLNAMKMEHVVAAQRGRRPLDDLIARTPGDGLVAGIGRVNTTLVGAERAACAVLSYDYTVLAGTQGWQNHRKKDRLFDLVERLRLPVVFFTEGGGGRPGDTDAPGVAALDCMAFSLFAGLSGLVPLVGINSGRCFAGNAALLGCCDVVIATADSTIGMGGPAMIEGGGLGVFRPEEVGPMAVQRGNGVVDIAVADEAEAVRVAKQYLSYFQGPLTDWTCDDQRRLRGLVPENRLRVYDVRAVVTAMADSGSVLELRRDFGLGMVTALARVEGRALGIVANDPRHLSGAIDAPAADKAARFLQLCDALSCLLYTSDAADE